MVFAATPNEKAEWMAHINKCIVDILAKSEITADYKNLHGLGEGGGGGNLLQGAGKRRSCVCACCVMCVAVIGI